MRLPDRLRRVWRWAASLLGAPARVSADAGPTPARSPVPTRSAHIPTPPARHRPMLDGDVVVEGDVVVRLWNVAGLVVLATSRAEAVRALVTLQAHADQTVRREASRLLDDLQEEPAAAA